MPLPRGSLYLVGGVLVIVWYLWRWRRRPAMHDLTGKTVLITGGARGIGRRTALQCMQSGAHVILAVRSVEQAEATASWLRSRSASRGSLDLAELDLASLQSVRKFVASFRASGKLVHCLINNAGAMGLAWGRTREGVETTLATNHLGAFVLTNGLAPALVATGDEARIVNVTSVLHGMARDLDDEYLASGSNTGSAMHRYATTKLYNVLFSNELARRLRGTRVTSNAVHPGNVITDITSNFFGTLTPYVNVLATGCAYALWFVGLGELTIVPEPFGAEGVFFVAAARELDGISGRYFHITRERAPSVEAQSADLAARLWDASVRLAAMQPGEEIPENLR